MRVRPGILTAVLLAASVCLTGCGGGDDKADASPSATKSRLGGPSDPLTETTVPCARFAATAKKITDAQAALYTGKGGGAPLEALVTELDGLKPGAPADVKAALTDMADGFRAASKLLDHPSALDRARLARLSPKLASDGQKISRYVVSRCS
ncbi:MAG: hypothetical protein ACJ72D_24520 [Marmoricola sp.]